MSIIFENRSKICKIEHESWLGWLSEQPLVGYNVGHHHTSVRIYHEIDVEPLVAGRRRLHPEQWPIQTPSRLRAKK